jgi:hypothetical protein
MPRGSNAKLERQHVRSMVRIVERGDGEFVGVASASGAGGTFAASAWWTASER